MSGTLIWDCVGSPLVGGHLLRQPPTRPHSFTHSLTVYSNDRSFVRLFVRSFVRSLAGELVDAKRSEAVATEKTQLSTLLGRRGMLQTLRAACCVLRSTQMSNAQTTSSRSVFVCV